MQFKMVIFCPDKPEVIQALISKASDNGAGIIGNYTQVAFVSKGTGQWKAEPGAKPHIGEVGKLSKEPEVRIEMVVPQEKVDQVKYAVEQVHPYEKPVIEFYKLEDVSL